MTAPNMETITASLEKSLQNCSLNHHQSAGESSSFSGIGRSSSSDDVHHHQNQNNFSDASLELNSNVSLPYNWEQCLDLKTGEIYYINWRNGMKAKEDPRTTAEHSGDCYSEDDDNSSYDSEESSSVSSPPPSNREHYRTENKNNTNVLVVAGCKSCLMYFMVPKQVEDCPKCTGQLLHFDRSDNSIP